MRNVSYFNLNIIDVDLEKENVMKYRIVYDYVDWRWYCSGWRYIGYLVFKFFMRVICVLGILVFLLIFVVMFIVGYNEVVIV